LEVSEVTQREHLKRLMLWLIKNEPLVDYAQVRPMQTISLSESDVAARFRQGKKITMDCSESVTVLCRWAGLRDPNGRGYNGAGYTGDELDHLPHYSDPAKAKVGALVVFGPGTGEHVCMVIESGPDPLLFSHGQKGGPIAIRLSRERQFHSPPVTFLSIGGLLSRPPSRPSVWSGKGMWIWNGKETNPARLCSSLAQHGYRWITVKAQDGASEFNDPAVIRAYHDAAKRHGLEFTIWGYLYGDKTPPEAEAKLASELIARYGAVGYVADVEEEYEHNTAPVSRRFVQTFRSLRPDFPLACSSFGRVDLHTGLDWSAWAAGDAAFMPQAYACESGQLEPKLCVDEAESFWPRAEQYVTLGAFKGHRGRMPVAELAASVHGLGVGGVNVWDAEECTPEELAGNYTQ
jgi:hypothetical protein